MPPNISRSFHSDNGLRKAFARYGTNSIWAVPALFLFFFLASSKQQTALAQCPFVAAIMVDACGPESANEFIIINSGGGFDPGDLFVDFDLNNNIIGPENNDINFGPGACGIQAGNPSLITGCSNVIAVGPGFMIPPNAFVVLQTSAGANTTYDFSGVCGQGQCIYVIQSTCFRSAGAFTNVGSGTRTTTIGLNSNGCSNSYTYDRNLLSGADGDYHLPPLTYGNNGCTSPPVSLGNPAPDIDPLPNQNVCGTSFTFPPITGTNLTGNQAYYTGPGGTGTSYQPGNTITTPGVYYIYDGANGCEDEESFTLTLQTPVTPALTPVGPLCSNDDPVALSTVQSGINGLWSGTGVNNNSFNPAGLSGTYTLTFTPNPGQCANANTLQVTVNAAPSATGTSLSECGVNNTATFDLTSVNNVVNGNSSNSVLWFMDPNGNTAIGNPSSFTSGNTVVFAQVYDGTCFSELVPVTLTVDPAPTPQLGTDTLCNNSGLYDLTNLQDPNYPNGTWTGPGVSGTNFNPAGLSGNVTLNFTPTGACAQATNTTITVNVPGPVSITGVPDTLCLADPPLALPTVQSGYNGSWSGNGVAADTLDPAQAGTGVHTLLFTPGPGECATLSSFDITIVPGDTVLLSGLPDTLCVLDEPLALPTMQGGVSGSWSGAGVSNDTLFPAVADTGLLVLTFTPASSACAAGANDTLYIRQADIPVISGLPASVCESELALPLDTLQGGFAGHWSGPGVVSDTLYPIVVGPDTITLFFVPLAGQCADTATASLIITAEAVPMLAADTICENSGLYDLTGLQDPAFPNGTWSGTGVSGNEFDPAGLSGSIALTFTPSAGCAAGATTNMEVLMPAQPNLLQDSTCAGGAAYDLSQLEDPAFPGGTWFGANVSNDTLFPPAGQGGAHPLAYLAPGCADTAYTSVELLLPPSVSNIVETCDLNTFEYTVSLDIAGGDPTTYTVNGNPAGASFTSTPIPSGTPYNFFVDDGNGCGPVTITGVRNCNCTTSAGSMQLPPSPLMLCEGSDFSVVHNGDEVLDGNDLLVFVLHDSSGTTLGNILATSSTTAFSWPGGLQAGQTYYVSAVAGNDDGSGGVDLNDPCLSVAQGVAVSFYLPSVNISPGDTICQGDCHDFALTFTGVGPFDLRYGINSVNGLAVDSLTSNGNNYTLTVCPADYGIDTGMVTVFTIELQDANCLVDNNNQAEETLYVAPEVTVDIVDTLCAGDSLVVNGVVYNENNSSGVEVIPGGSSLGCDSTINVQLSFHPAAVFDLQQNLCSGNSLTVNGTVYDENNPTGTEVIPGGSFTGCDSTINVMLTFSSGVVNDLDSLLCPGGSVLVNGVVYDQNNPTGTETIPNGSYLGCDSIINVALSFSAPAIFNLDSTLCSNQTVTVNGTVYSEFNPAGTEVLPGASYLGCDSTVMVNLSFYPPAEGDLLSTLCSGDSIVINGNVYNEANPEGMEVLAGASVNGCDSILNISLNFHPPALGAFFATLCPGESITIGGVVYDENNPMGSVVIPGGSYTGCDSTVVVNLDFYPPAVNNLDDELCDGGSIVVNSTVYDAANPTGMETLPGASVNGCDSIVNINLTFAPPVVVNLDTSLCAGEFIYVNGNLYNASNPTGTEVVPNGSVDGCDSTILVSVSYYPPAVGYLDTILQPGESIIVNGTLYDHTNLSGTEIFPGGSYTGCDSTLHITLMYEGDLEAFVSTTSPSCPGGFDGTVTVGGATGGLPPYTVIFDVFDQVTTDTFPVVFTDVEAGPHLVEIIDATGVVLEMNIEVQPAPELFLDLGDGYEVPLGDAVVLQSQRNFEPATWEWSPPDYLDCADCPDPVSTPQDDILYTLVATSEDGCTVTDEVQVTVKKVRRIFVPNAFSPNGDGINDLLSVFAGPQVEVVEQFMIFDRWGANVFSSENFAPNDVTRGWDGRHKGKPMDPAVFTWFAKVRFIDGHTEIFEGDVVLMR
ncbi:MAG: hypothetical protein CMN32_12410 [Saprospirales bacterium]|nr:hypothetical protein [Saprospirales bacterium]